MHVRMRLEILQPVRTIHNFLHICRLGRQNKEAGCLKHKQLAAHKKWWRGKVFPAEAQAEFPTFLPDGRTNVLRNPSEANLLCHCHVTLC
jgi:hypothetical protein